jgi:hypothetical protein
MCSPISGVLLVLCCLLLGSYVAAFCVVTCRRMQRRDQFVATQPLESNAPLRHAFNRTKHKSPRTNLFRPCRLCERGTTPLDTVDEAV